MLQVILAAHLLKVSVLNLKSLKRHLLFNIAMVFFSGSSVAQGLFSFGAGMNRYGVSGHVKFERNEESLKKFKTGDLKFEIGNVMHPREIALINHSLQKKGVYKFGKINYAWTARPYYMAKYQISSRQDKKSVELNAVGGVGIPLAYTWPVYILLYDPQAGPNDMYTPVKYDPEVHPQAYIGGRAPFSMGINDGRFIPGLGLDAGLEFSWGNYRSEVKMVTLGMRLEAYSRQLPIMYISQMNQSLYSMFYLTFAFGFGNN